MASKYLNLEEAAARLSISVEELNRRREQNEIRAFADRGTWKFRSDDVEELARTLEPDSSVDFGVMGDEGVLGDIPSAFNEDSKINFDESVGEQPTIISKNSPGTPPSSDSDVRLVVDPILESDAGPMPPSSDAEKDSDVRFVDEELANVTPTPVRISEEDSQNKIAEADDELGSISDSDVRLAPADSDVSIDSDIIVPDNLEETIAMTPSSDEDSDSDVTLLGATPDPDLSDIRLEEMGGTDSDITLMPPDDDSSIRLEEHPDDDQSVLSDVVTDPASGLSFSSGDSGISLDLSVDSGINLESDDDDDSITLASESGISLVPDSGLGLSLDEDSSDQDDSLTLADGNDVGGATIPMLDVSDEDDENDTAFDMPLLEDSGEMITEDDDSTGVVMFDDESDEQTMEFDSSDMDSSDEFVDFDDDSYDELSDAELDVSDDLLDDDDILEADDDSFEDDFESGESVPALAIPGGIRGGAAAVAAEWDMLSFSLVLFSTGFMGICVLLMFDLVRSMWGYAEPFGVNGMILETLQGIIKS